MNYTERVIPGRYEITDNMNNRQLLQLLRSGKQVPIKITFNNIRTKLLLIISEPSQTLQVESANKLKQTAHKLQLCSVIAFC